MDKINHQYKQYVLINWRLAGTTNEGWKPPLQLKYQTPNKNYDSKIISHVLLEETCYTNFKKENASTENGKMRSEVSSWCEQFLNVTQSALSIKRDGHHFI